MCAVRLITPPDVPEVFVSGLGHIEVLSGGVARFYFYREIHRGDEVERETVLFMIGPVSAIGEALQLLHGVPQHVEIALPSVLAD